MTKASERWIAAALTLAAAAACAHIEAPPGGPEDKAAPQLIATRPDTMARLGSYQGDVLFVFDEGLSEQGIDTLVTVSPRTGGLDVDKSGDELSIGLRGGWRPGRIYQVEVGAGLQDRFGNRTTQPIRLVFSTGPEIPNTAATGTVIDRTTNQPLRGAWVEAILRPDSLVYVTRTDSAGAWRLTQIPAGTYGLRAFTDQNRSRQLEEFEARDTGTVVIAPGDTVARARRLAVVLPDTTPPLAGSARGEGDVVEIRFDDFLDPAQPLTPAQVTITGPDGATVAVTEVRVGPFPGARGDSVTAADSTRVQARPGALPGQPARPGQPAVPARDSAAAAAPREPAPARSLFARTAAPLVPEATYRVSVRGVRNLLGLVGGG
ncbi:MAG TPA: Ig-like domain-containing protein, partial [Longimicrobium sp.]|nr:Ig-like domain-containing protein [Longimicrobium sp.]